MEFHLAVCADEQCTLKLFKTQDEMETFHETTACYHLEETITLNDINDSVMFASNDYANCLFSGTLQNLKQLWTDIFTIENEMEINAEDEMEEIINEEIIIVDGYEKHRITSNVNSLEFIIYETPLKRLGFERRKHVLWLEENNESNILRKMPLDVTQIVGRYL
jgi:hypothetical protein